MAWWNSLSDLQRFFASIAAPATLVMVLQFILMLLGLAHGSGADSADGADSHGDMNLHDGASHGGLDGHTDDMFNGHSDGAFDGHEHDVFSGHGHEAFGDHHDVFNGNAHEGLSGHSGGAFDGHNDGIFGGDAHEALSGHSDGAFDGHADDSSGGTYQDTLNGNSHEGAGHENGENHDRSDALRLLTLRGIIAFLSVGGWMGVAAIDWKLPGAVAIVLALAAGWLALYFVAWIIRAFVRMQQSGNVRPENAVGRDGDVYLTIPANGHGKVNVIIQDRLCEMDAVTRSGRDIKTGEKITVLGVASEGVLLVAPKSTPKGVEIQKSIKEVI